jgi:DNA-binding transcriptional LysR family regulator
VLPFVEQQVGPSFLLIHIFLSALWCVRIRGSLCRRLKGLGVGVSFSPGVHFTGASIMRWRFDDILTFVQVMEAGSVTAAAARLNVSKSVISKRISDLEAALDVELFRRSTHHLKPTESGEAFYERMVPLIQEINETTERVGRRQQALQGRMRITTPMSFGTMYLGPVFAEFARQHPDLELAIDYEDRMVDLVRNGYDVGVRIAHLKDSSLIARKLCDCPRGIYCSPGYAEAHGVPKSIDELPAHACIDYAHVHTSQFWQFESGKPGQKPVSVLVRSRIVVNNGEVMRDMAIAGLGILNQPYFLVAEALRGGKLIHILPEARPIPYTISAVYPPTRRVSTKVRTFIDFLADYFTPLPPWERSIDTRSIGQRNGRAAQQNPL